MKPETRRIILVSVLSRCIVSQAIVNAPMGNIMYMLYSLLNKSSPNKIPTSMNMKEVFKKLKDVDIISEDEYEVLKNFRDKNFSIPKTILNEYSRLKLKYGK